MQETSVETDDRQAETRIGNLPDTSPKRYLFTRGIYRVIKSSTTTLKEVVREIIWSRKCNFFFFRFATVSE
jgi:hypothetical protein